MLRADRTPFDKGFRKVAVVVPNDHPAYDELAAKYEHVFRATAASAQAAFTSAFNVLETNSNDAVYVYPGTYVLSATITVSKNVTITGPNDNKNSAIIDADTSAVIAFTFGATSDYAIVKNLTINVDAVAAAVSIPVTAPGVVFENVVFADATTTTTATTVAIVSSAANLVVKDCDFRGVKFGIRNTGANSLFAGNYFYSGKYTAPVGIDQTTGDYGVIRNNVFHYSTATALCVRFGNVAAVTGEQIYDNRANTGTTCILGVNSSVNPALYNNMLSTLTPVTTVTSVMTYVAT